MESQCLDWVHVHISLVKSQSNIDWGKLENIENTSLEEMKWYKEKEKTAVVLKGRDSTNLNLNILGITQSLK